MFWIIISFVTIGLMGGVVISTVMTALSPQCLFVNCRLWWIFTSEITFTWLKQIVLIYGLVWISATEHSGNQSLMIMSMQVIFTCHIALKSIWFILIEPGGWLAILNTSSHCLERGSLIFFQNWKCSIMSFSRMCSVFMLD